MDTLFKGYNHVQSNYRGSECIQDFHNVYIILLLKFKLSVV